MTIAFTLFALLIVLSVIAILLDVYLTDYPGHGWSSMVLIPILFCSMYCALDTARIEYKPVEYTAETTSFKVFAKTPDAVYESERKVDFDEWTQNKPGFVQEEHNHFGGILRTKFTVNKLETK